MYIISYNCTLEKLNVQQVVINAPLEAATFFNGAVFTRHHYYALKYNGQNLDILCPGYRLADEMYVVVIPWYLIPDRPYPLQVYQFACSYYSANPDIGQRGAAEATRTKFGLETFSHSTVCRSFRSFEKSRRAALEKRYGEEIKASGTEGITIVGAAPKADAGCGGAADTDEKRHSEKRFPSVADTARRREIMAGFLPKFENNAKRADIEAAGCRFVRAWHEKSRRLLI